MKDAMHLYNMMLLLDQQQRCMHPVFETLSFLCLLIFFSFGVRWPLLLILHLLSLLSNASFLSSSAVMCPPPPT